MGIALVHDQAGGIPEASDYYSWASTQFLSSSGGEGQFGSVKSIGHFMKDIMIQLTTMKTAQPVLICCHGTPDQIALRAWHTGSPGLGVVQLENLASDDPKPSVSGVHQGDLDILIDCRDTVRAMQLPCVTLRACRVGTNPRLMWAFRSFFGAKSVAAPKLRTRYFHLDPKVAANGDDWKRFDRLYPTAETYQYGSGWSACKLKIDIKEGAHGRLIVTAMMDDERAVREFMKQKFPDPPKAVNGVLPLHGLLHDGKVVYPKDYNYAAFFTTFTANSWIRVNAKGYVPV